MILELPVPPSVNHCWGHSRFGAYRKPQYKAWLAESAIAANEQKVQAVPGPIEVAVTVFPGEGWNIRRDLDNILKATLDLCGGRGLIDGDDCRTLQVLSVCVGMPQPKACIRVTITPLQNPIQIFTKAEARRSARTTIPRAKKDKKLKVEASTTEPVENAAQRSFFPTVEELRDIARESKSRGKKLAEAIAARCCSA